MPRSILPVLAALTLGVLSASANASRPDTVTSSASAVAIRVVSAGGAGAQTPFALPGSPETSPSFAYPADGSIIVGGAVAGSAATRHGAGVADAAGSASAANVSLFDGEITVASVAASASSTTALHGAGGRFGASAVIGLEALGQRVSGRRVALGSWGVLTVDARSVNAAAPHGTRSWAGSVVGLEVVLLQAHGGLRAGSRIEIATVSVGAQTAPPVVSPRASPGPLPGDRPQLLPATSGPLLGVPQPIAPSLEAGPYVYPVYGRSLVTALYGALAPDGGYRHGIAIAGVLGQPLVAVASGTIYALGYTQAAGNELRLRDRQGNEFDYAHLSAFSALVSVGAHVQAGQVVGFMGTTGEPPGSAPLLGFEVHPVSYLYLGEQGAVDPSAYLGTWRPVASVALSGPAWAPSVRRTVQAPEPGAALLSSSDISAASGIGAAALRRVLGGASAG